MATRLLLPWSGHHLAAEPRCGDGDYYEGEGIPFRSKLGTAIPRCGRAPETQDKADDAEQNSVLYGFARRESSSDVATSNSVNDAISEGQQKE